MTNISGTVATEERLQWLHDRLASDGFVTIAGAAEELGVSEMTVRRALDELEKQGAARRVRGGAKPVGPRPFAERSRVSARAKSRMAEKLRTLVPESGTLAFDASSTIMRLAGSLTGARDLTILTNGPDTFAALRGVAGITALLTGGRLEERTGSLVGPLACRAAGQLSVQTFFASAAAVTPHAGGHEATLEEAEVKRSIAVGAERVVLAVDSSKLNGRGVAVGLEWDDIDVLVTELTAGDGRLEPYRGLTELL